MRPATARIAWKFILVADAAVVLYGLLLVLMPAGMLSAGFGKFTGQSWGSLRAESSATADYVAMLGRVLGALNVAFGVMGCAVALGAFRRGATWAWYALLIGNTFGYGGPVAYDLTVRSITIFELLEMALLLLVYAALAMTAKDIVGARFSAAGSTSLADGAGPTGRGSGATGGRSRR